MYLLIMKGGIRMDSLNILLVQSFNHMAGSEEQAKEIVEDYAKKHNLKRSQITHKTKKGVEFWIVSVTISHVSEKDAFDMYFGE